MHRIPLLSFEFLRIPLEFLLNSSVLHKYALLGYWPQTLFSQLPAHSIAQDLSSFADAATLLINDLLHPVGEIRARVTARVVPGRDRWGVGRFHATQIANWAWPNES